MKAFLLSTKLELKVHTAIFRKQQLSCNGVAWSQSARLDAYVWRYLLSQNNYSTWTAYSKHLINIGGKNRSTSLKRICL